MERKVLVTETTEIFNVNFSVYITSGSAQDTFVPEVKSMTKKNNASETNVQEVREQNAQSQSGQSQNKFKTPEFASETDVQEVREQNRQAEMRKQQSSGKYGNSSNQTK